MLDSVGPDLSSSLSHDLIAKVREQFAYCIKANLYCKRVATAKLQIHVDFALLWTINRCGRIACWNLDAAYYGRTAMFLRELNELKGLKFE